MSPTKLEEDELILSSIEDKLEAQCYSGDQLRIFDELAVKISHVVQLSVLETRGFLISAIKAWEKESGLKFGEMRLVPPDQKVQLVTRIFEILRKDLISFTKQGISKTFFEEEYGKVLLYYVEKYSNRPFN
jgi:hypothetical protein